MALMLSVTAVSAQTDKTIRTVAVPGDSHSTFDGYIPEGNAS